MRDDESTCFLRHLSHVVQRDGVHIFLCNSQAKKNCIIYSQEYSFDVNKSRSSSFILWMEKTKRKFDATDAASSANNNNEMK